MQNNSTLTISFLLCSDIALRKKQAWSRYTCLCRTFKAIDKWFLFFCFFFKQKNFKALKLRGIHVYACVYVCVQACLCFYVQLDIQGTWLICSSMAITVTQQVKKLWINGILLVYWKAQYWGQWNCATWKSWLLASFKLCSTATIKLSFSPPSEW